MTLAQSGLGQYYGVQGTTWKPPDPLQPHRDAGQWASAVRVYFNGGKLSLVAWRAGGRVLDLQHAYGQLPAGQMIGMAASLTRRLTR